MTNPTVKNTYTGDGSTSLFPFTFPYIQESDVKVYLDGVEQTITTEFEFSNATTIGFITPPAQDAVILIQRKTTYDDLKATFFPGSAIRARDLNDNFVQNLYVVQENAQEATDATAAAEAAQASAAAAAEDAKIAASADAKATTALAGVSTAEAAAVSAQNDAASAQADAAQAATDASQAATDAAQAASDAADALAAVGSGPVVSVNGITGVVSLGISDLNDVDTSTAGHIPSDGQSLVWDAAMGHWMPADASIDIPTLPTLP